jgi:RNA recognition motif-containing protein
VRILSGITQDGTTNTKWLLLAWTLRHSFVKQNPNQYFFVCDQKSHLVLLRTKNKIPEGVPSAISFLSRLKMDHDVDLPTFRLFVRYSRPLATEQEEEGLRALFEGCAQVTRLQTRLGQWRYSFVAFSSTEEAKKAREKLHKTQFQGQTLDVHYAVPSRRVVVRGLPRGVSFTSVSQALHIPPRADVEMERDDMWQGNEDIALLFGRVDDAKAFVADMVARGVTFEGRTLSFDFTKEYDAANAGRGRDGHVGRHVGRESGYTGDYAGGRTDIRTETRNDSRDNNGRYNRNSREQVGHNEPRDSARRDSGGNRARDNGARNVGTRDVGARDYRSRDARSKSIEKDYRSDSRRDQRSSSKDFVRSRSQSRSPARSSPSRRIQKRSRSPTKADASTTRDGGRIDQSQQRVEKARKVTTSPARNNWSPSGNDEDSDNYLGYNGPPMALLTLASPRAPTVVVQQRQPVIHVDQQQVLHVGEIQSPPPSSTIMEDNQVVAPQQVDEPAIGGGGEDVDNKNGEGVVDNLDVDGENDEHDVNQPCTECARLLGELKAHVSADHSSGPNEVQKAVIKAWFESHYIRKTSNADVDVVGAGEVPVPVSRKALLGEINTFLEGMGWPIWKTQSGLYKDWFLREIMALSQIDISKGRNWCLFYRDGFAPGGNGDDARNRQQRMEEMIIKLREFMHVV